MSSSSSSSSGWSGSGSGSLGAVVMMTLVYWSDAAMMLRRCDGRGDSVCAVSLGSSLSLSVCIYICIFI